MRIVRHHHKRGALALRRVQHDIEHAFSRDAI
jgi:hypothetical protein